MAEFTSKAIKQSFLKLLNERPLAKITVKDVVEDCGINRNSFYYHYEDLPSLLEEILYEEADALLTRSLPITSAFDCLVTALDFAMSNKKAILHIYSSASKSMYENYIEKVSRHVVANYIGAITAGKKLSRQDTDIIIEYHMHLLIGFTRNWIENGMKYDVTDKLRRMCELFDGATPNAVQRAETEYRENV